MRKVATALLVALIPLSAAACGGSDGGSGTRTEQISKDLQDKGLPQGQADCAAKALVEAGFTKAEVAKLEKDGKGIDQAKMKKFTATVLSCVGVGS